MFRAAPSHMQSIPNPLIIVFFSSFEEHAMAEKEDRGVPRSRKIAGVPPGFRHPVSICQRRCRVRSDHLRKVCPYTLCAPTTSLTSVTRSRQSPRQEDINLFLDLLHKRVWQHDCHHSLISRETKTIAYFSCAPIVVTVR